MRRKTMVSPPFREETDAKDPTRSLRARFSGRSNLFNPPSEI
jgi:hypothetical protein